VSPVAGAAAQGAGGGTDPWLVVGVALIAATAALLGAVIAARTASTRQKEQLAHEERRQTKALSAEKERHDATLSAEHQRHEATLRHEERQQDLEEMRRVLDDTLEAIAQVDAAKEVALRTWHALCDQANEPAGPHVGQELTDQLYVMHAATNRVAIHVNRLALRIGDDHDATKAVSDVTRSMRAVLRQFQEQPSGDRRKEPAKAWTHVNELIMGFRAVAHEEIRVRRNAEAQAKADVAETASSGKPGAGELE
jgi:hypothetical protein